MIYYSMVHSCYGQHMSQLCKYKTTSRSIYRNFTFSEGKTARRGSDLFLNASSYCNSQGTLFPFYYAASSIRSIV